MSTPTTRNTTPAQQAQIDALVRFGYQVDVWPDRGTVAYLSQQRPTGEMLRAEVTARGDVDHY